MRHDLLLVTPPSVPPLDPDFKPAVLGNRAFLRAVEESGKGVPLRIALVRGDGSVSTFDTRAFAPDAPLAAANLTYAERLVKFLLWQRGGWKVIVGGPAQIGEHIRKVYSPQGERAFDYEFMGETVYEKPFTVEITDAESVPGTSETTAPLGRHLDGCRVGFDLGASDRKTSAVVEGEDVFTEEVKWDPKTAKDWQYHYEGIKHSIQRAVDHLPRVDAIGGSAAGVYINNRAMVASLFRGVPKDDFNAHIKPLFENLGKEFGVPLVVVNDGEVTALAGSMSLEANAVLGVAMGSSEAAGYVTPDGNITGWLNELAFAPVDFNPNAPQDEWSGDIGCGVNYFCQTGVMRLAAAAGLEFEAEKSVPERLEDVQAWMKEGKPGVAEIYESIGIQFGYTIAHYADFYEIEKMLILGRVTTGSGGDLILEKAQDVLAREFPELSTQIECMLPNEKLRRVGQAIAAASLPVIA
ncbi:MAG: ROK family protein [Armatimonadetes bacterium]|nr:ROK family protein [Armatimonadota bacterium]MDI9585178.1 ROK family protein [Acidobacteriota bacterium]